MEEDQGMSADEDVPLQDDRFIAELIAVCRESAEIVLQLVFVPSADESSPCLKDWRHFASNFADSVNGQPTEPATWIAIIVSTYLRESAHLCQAAAELIRTRTHVVAIGLVVRAIVERIGRLLWVLDPAISAHQRAARAGLEMTVGQQEYRKTIEQLKASKDDQKWARDEHVRLRDLLRGWFQTVDQPPDDPCDRTSDPTPDATRWTVDGEPYPSYADLTHVVLRGERSHAFGTYGAYSGLTHPNVQFAREHRHYTDQGAITYSYKRGDLEKDVRMAAFVMLDGVRHWAAYLRTAEARLQERIDELGGRMDAVSVLPPPPNEEST